MVDISNIARARLTQRWRQNADYCSVNLNGSLIETLKQKDTDQAPRYWICKCTPVRLAHCILAWPWLLLPH